MKLRDKDLLVAHMKHRDFTQARLARYAGCSRQFIHALVTGDKGSCTPEVGRHIEEALDVPAGTLFLRQESPVTRRVVVPRKTTRSAA